MSQAALVVVFRRTPSFTVLTAFITGERWIDGWTVWWMRNWMDGHIQRERSIAQCLDGHQWQVASLRCWYWDQHCLISSSATQTVGLSASSAHLQITWSWVVQLTCPRDRIQRDLDSLERWDFLLKLFYDSTILYFYCRVYTQTWGMLIGIIHYWGIVLPSRIFFQWHTTYLPSIRHHNLKCLPLYRSTGSLIYCARTAFSYTSNLYWMPFSSWISAGTPGYLERGGEEKAKANK